MTVFRVIWSWEKAGLCWQREPDDVQYGILFNFIPPEKV